MILTIEIFKQAKSSNGGYNKLQIEALGQEWPTRKGWMDKIVNNDFSEDQISAFLKLKDVHFTKERIVHLKNKGFNINFQYVPLGLPYSDQYKHPNWQKMRLMVLKRDGFACINCGSKDKMLHAHHLKYKRGKYVWEVPIWYIVTLCEDCHSEEHGRDLTVKK